MSPIDRIAEPFAGEGLRLYQGEEVRPPSSLLRGDDQPAGRCTSRGDPACWKAARPLHQRTKYGPFAHGGSVAAPGDQFEVESAGTQPAPAAHPLASAAMQEVDVDLSAFYPRSSQTLNLDDCDLIIVLAPRDEAQQPHLNTATEVIQWRFADPADTAGTENEQLRAFRRVRDELRTRVALYVNSTRRGDVPPPAAP